MSGAKMIVDVNSTKGGVGKSTLALATAVDRLRGQGMDGPTPKVVLIDADIFGSELGDLLAPYSGGSEPDRWQVSLMETLVQSSGGNSTIRELLKEQLVSIRDAETSPQTIDLVQGAAPLLLIPTMALRDPSARRELLDPYHGATGRLDLTLVAESVGRLQLELRLTALVDAVLEVFEPELVVLDQAPFHFPLSQVPQRWREPEALSGLLWDRAARGRWDAYQKRSLEVSGPDRQDLVGLVAEINDKQRRDEGHEAGRRWVVNRDVHRGTGGDETCNTIALTDVGPWQRLGHVTLSPLLYLGVHNRNTAGIFYGQHAPGSDGDAEPGSTVFDPNDARYAGRDKDLPYPYIKRLNDALQGGDLLPRVLQPGGFVEQSWAEFLA